MNMGTRTNIKSSLTRITVMMTLENDIVFLGVWTLAVLATGATGLRGVGVGDLAPNCSRRR
jgi:hypothetical protein